MLEHQVQLKQNQRDEIAEKMARFIMQNGTINVIPSNVFGNADMALSDGRRPESFPTMKREKNNG